MTAPQAIRPLLVEGQRGETTGFFTCEAVMQILRLRTRQPTIVGAPNGDQHIPLLGKAEYVESIGSTVHLEPWASRNASSLKTIKGLDHHFDPQPGFLGMNRSLIAVPFRRALIATRPPGLSEQAQSGPLRTDGECVHGLQTTSPTMQGTATDRAKSLRPVSVHQLHSGLIDGNEDKGLPIAALSRTTC